MNFIYTNLTTRRYKAMLLAFLSLFFLSGSLMAQVSTKYVFSSSTNNAYNEIATGTPLLVNPGAAGGSVDDDDYFDVPFGFSFFYNGVSFTRGFVNCNGYIKLGTTPPRYPYSYGPAISYEPNTIAAFSTDLAGKGATSAISGLMVETIGTAPYRIFVIQYKDWTVFNGNAAIMAGETYNFQIQLHENDGNGYPMICYGKMISNFSNTCQVGISGTTANPGNPPTITDYNVRATSWINSTSSLTNTGYNMAYSTANVPDSGLFYKWAIPPQKMVLDSVSTTSVSGGVTPGTTDNAVIAAVVYTKGDSAKKFVTELNFNMNGSTNIADITAAKVYFSGTNSNFSVATSTQFGSTIYNPASGTLNFTGLDSLNPGANHFWLTYDVSASATLGDYLDGECVSVIDSIIYTNIPLISSPAGRRQIVQPMSGIYTIDPAGSGGTNFTSFQQAFNAMDINGLAGPVTFTVAAGTYAVTAPIVMTTVPGLSSANTITFEGANKTTTIISGNLPSSQIIQVNAKYITLRNFTITNTASGSASAITLLGSSSSNVCTGTNINNCIINLPNASGSGAAIGMTIDATGNSFNTSVLMDSVMIDSNVITGGNYAVGIFGALNISFNRGFKFRDNKVSETKGYTAYFQYVMNTIEILRNEINITSGGGIYMFGCEGNSSHLVSGNKIKGFTTYGVEFRPNTGASPSPYPTRVYNNLLVSSSNSANNCLFFGMGTPSPLEMYHNTFIYNAITTTAAYGPVQTTGSGVLLIKNNIFVNNANGGTNSALYLGSNPPANNINYNVYYNRNAANPNLVNRTGFQYTTSTFKTTTAGGDSSHNTMPVFDAQDKLINGCSPKTQLDLTYLLPSDVNGVTRAVPAYIGAHESTQQGNDMSIDAVLSPVAPAVPGLTDVIVRVKNAGTNPVFSFNLNYIHNGNPVVTQSIFQTIQSCDTASFSFSQQVTLTSSNQIELFTSVPNGIPDDNMSNDTSRVGIYGALSGVYTIGGGSSNFPTVVDAVTALNQSGVNGPVQFIIAPGTYSGQVVINGATVLGLSATNNVVFEGANAATTIITSAASAQGTVVINQCNYISFRNLTIANSSASTPIGIAVVGNQTTLNNGTGTVISNCIVNTLNAGTSTSWGINFTGTAGGNGNSITWADSISIDSNTVNGAYYGIYFTGRGDTLSNVEVKMRNNSVRAFGYGFYLYNVHNGYNMLNNTVNMFTPNFTSGYAYSGIMLDACTNKRLAGPAIRINGNKVYNFQNYGIYISAMATAGTLTTQLYNNTLASSPLNAYRSLHLNSNSGSAEIYHNTFVHSYATSTTSYGAAYIGGAVLANTMIKNNIFANTSASGGTTPLYVDGTTPSGNVDYNVYYNSANANLIYRAGMYTAANFNTANAGGANSFNVQPTFVNLSAYDLHLTSGCLPKGLDLTANVPADIDGNPRPVTPQIGSSEYLSASLDLAVLQITQPVFPIASGLQNVVVTVRNNGSSTLTGFNVSYVLNSGTPVTQAWSGSLAPCATATVTFSGAQQINVISGSTNNLSVYSAAPNSGTDANTSNDTVKAIFGTPLSGTYVIGSAPSDFTTFNDAVSALTIRGVAGPVVFDVKTGSYSEQIVLGNVLGSSAANRITFKAQNNNRTSVTIGYSATSTNDNYVVKLNNASNIKLQSLTISASGSSYARAVELAGTFNNDTIIDCAINVTPLSTTSSDMTGVFASNVSGTNNVIRNNTISNGGFGIYFFGISTANMHRGTLIENNIIQNAYYMSMYLYYSDSLKVRNNTVNHSASSPYYYGIYANFSYNNSAITGNKVNMPAGGTAIQSSYMYGTSGARSVIANNAVTIGGANSAYGIMNQYSYYTDVNNNSVNVSSNNASGAAGYFYYSSPTYGNNRIYNNIFANNGGGYAVYHYDPSVALSNAINYNLLYTTGPVLVQKYNQSTFINDNYATLEAWRAVSGSIDINSIAMRVPFTSSTNLTINTADTAAWFVNGGGVQMAGNSSDINGNMRSSSLIDGAPDMGAYEMTPSALAPMAVAVPDVPVAGGTQAFLYGPDTIAKITWSPFASAPSTIAARMYTGAYVSGVTGSSHDALNSYWEFDAPAGSYSYDLSLYYRETMLGSISSEAAMVGAQSTGNLVTPWNILSSTSTVNAGANVLTLTGLSDLTRFTGTTTANPIPVKLTEFKAVAMGNDVLVYWNTASEKNASHFNVEASADGKNFVQVSKVPAKGNSSVSTRYSFTHEDAQRAMGNASVIYYRLTSVDKDGSSSKSSVVIVNFGKPNNKIDAVTVYPNPFASHLTVSVPSLADGVAKVSVMDLQGKTLHTSDQAIVQGSNSIELNALDNFEQGIYLVKVSVNSESKVIKVVKQ